VTDCYITGQTHSAAGHN